MKRFIFTIVFLLCISIAAAESGFIVNNVYGDTGVLGMSIDHKDEDIANARVKAAILDYGIIFPARNVDVKEDNPQSLAFMTDEYIPEGEYLVRISTRKDGRRSVVYRYVWFE